MENNFAKKFINKSDVLLDLLRNRNSNYWAKRGEMSALRVFHEAADKIPAYKKFLKSNKIKPNLIKTVEDFQKLPVTNKENYLHKYPIEELCPNGVFDKNRWIISSTSGSTGEPFYFPRTDAQDRQFSLTAEVCLKEYFDIHKKSTLFINCFALGVWIGGMFMYQAVKSLMNSKRYNLSTITPGADKTEAIKAVKKLASKFDQIIIGGYGPLVKDLIDDGTEQGINWKRYNIRFFFAAEGFTEDFRDYIAKETGTKNVYLDLINHYGTADMGTMAHETPLSIIVRRIADDNNKIHKEIFKDAHSLPTFMQYIPELFYFETVKGRLTSTSPSGMPLIRYDLKDNGGTYSFDEPFEILKKHNIDLNKEIKKKNLQDKIWNLPFVYLYERADFTVSIYSVNIYPESVRKALQKRKFKHCITGKFTMRVDFNNKQNQVFEINLELRPEVVVDVGIKTEIKVSIVSSLYEENSEWRDFYNDVKIRNKIIPKLIYWPYQHPKYFKPGGKQKWVKK